MHNCCYILHTALMVSLLAIGEVWGNLRRPGNLKEPLNELQIWFITYVLILHTAPLASCSAIGEVTERLMPPGSSRDPPPQLSNVHKKLQTRTYSSNGY